jgi:hypothetical protein
MYIITGPRVEIDVTLIDRMKQQFLDRGLEHKISYLKNLLRYMIESLYSCLTNTRCCIGNKQATVSPSEEQTFVAIAPKEG